MIHRKINNKRECVCGSKMFYWKGLWFCKKQFVGMAKRQKAVVDKVIFCDAYYCKFNKVSNIGMKICSRNYLHIGDKEENCKDFETTR